MKHCNLPFTKCYPVFCTLSNFDTSGGEYLHQFVQYYCFVHFKISSRIKSVNILCHTHTRPLIIKILNHKETKLNMIIRKWEMGKKMNTVYMRKVGDLTEVHTHYLLPSNIPPRNTTPCVTHYCCIWQSPSAINPWPVRSWQIL